jgi:parallel beta-helix repeat protein
MEAAFYYPATTTAEHNIVGGANDVGISQNSAENVIINDNYVGVDITGTVAVPNGSGINLGFGASTVTNNLVAGNNGNGIWAYQTITDQVDINNNRIGVDVNNNPMGNGSNGIEFQIFNDSTNTINVNDNVISNNLGAGGVYTTQSNIQSGMRIFNNTIDANLNTGIAISHHQVEIFNNTVTGNNNGLGITNTPNDLNVHDNNLSNNLGSGANVSGANHTYNNNTANNNGGGGLELSLSGTITVTNNTANNNVGGGISASGNSGTINNNTTTNNDFGLSAGLDSGTVNSNISNNNLTVGINLTGTNFPGFTASNNQAYSNGTNGMYISGTAVNVVGNFVGVDNSNTPLGNGEDGIFVQNTNNSTIGGPNPGDENQIAANGQSGIHIYGCQNNLSWGNQIIGNNIGVNSAGTVVAGYGNGGSGIEINEQELLGCGGGGGGSIYKNIIGGDSSGQKNIIAGNAEDGIRIYQSSNTDVFSNAILPNEIFENGNLGINLAADSANTGNADTDLGPNALNNYIMTLPTVYANNYFNRPVITATPFSGNQLTVEYDYNPNQVDNSTLSQADVVGYRLDFYLNDVAQDGAYAGYNQGKIHLGSIIVNSAEVNATHTFTSPVPLNDNMSVNATATMLWQVQPAPSCTPPEDTGPPYRGTCT